MSKRLKKVQLWLHRNYPQIRSGLLVIMGVMLLVFSMIMISNQNRLISQVRDLAEQNNALSKQNRVLGEENQSIAKQNRAYSRCIATIFAQYTHDFVPITITNLDTCTLDSQTQATDSTPPGGTAPGPSSAQPQVQPQPQPAQPQNSTGTTPMSEPSLVDRINTTVNRLLDGAGL